ncbi:sigma-54 dependent transcriptional regulator [Deltaproteobacteria bacterium OttesenSCG-928-M10]|nr:sigma-54 dependent transcriptional regulator [Deltaproteobacteria bacterium OttesenSCG-928-M10]
MNILICWIGNTDLKCAEQNASDNLGPIVQALKAGGYNKAIFLDNFKDARVDAFCHWLHGKVGLEPEIHSVRLTAPTNHKEIYEAARNLVADVRSRHPDDELTFHISPGTPAMALAWLLLAPSYGAKVIESSREHGVTTVQFPFEIAAYFLPDKDLIRLAVDAPPVHPAFADILHQSEAMRKVVVQAQRIAPRDVTVLIEGESGTGKELFARAIHGGSRRASKPFVAVNCGAIPGELVESALFGYKKGAFSGAVQDTSGFFQAADQGSLFLDELGELPLAAQVKLLRVLQERTVTRVGDTKPQAVDVRIIAATNRNLLKETTEGRFRSDLFYRLAVAVLRLPPLRERNEDTALLLEDALVRANQELLIRGREKDKKFSDSAIKIMLNHSWPGNIRELHNTVMRAVLWSTGEVIDEHSVRQAMLLPENRETSIWDRPLGNGFSLKGLLDEVAAHYIRRAESEAHGVKAKASALLGFKNYQTFTNWRDKF